MMRAMLWCGFLTIDAAPLRFYESHGASARCAAHAVRRDGPGAMTRRMI